MADPRGLAAASPGECRDTLNITEDLTRLDAPARIVWGTADRFQKLQYGERLAWDLDAELTRVEGGKHWVPEDLR